MGPPLRKTRSRYQTKHRAREINEREQGAMGSVVEERMILGRC